MCLFFFCIVVNVQDLLNILQHIAPDTLARNWDNVGLLVGSPYNRVTSVLLALDPLPSLIAEAQEYSAELIITHHPAIFHPLKSLRTDRPEGRFIAAALRAGISVIGCHTNLDAACGGVNDVLARALGLTEILPLVPEKDDPICGMGRIGRLPVQVSAQVFLHRLREAVPFPWLLEAGPRPASVAQVAVCGGSCSDLTRTAYSAGADIFITSEIKHDVARLAEEIGMWLLDGGHFSTENPAMSGLMELLADRMNQAGMDVRLHLARQEAPLRLVPNQLA